MLDCAMLFYVVWPVHILVPTLFRRSYNCAFGSLNIHQTALILHRRTVIYLIKVKVKFSLCLTKHHAMKTYRGSRGIAALILDIGTRWRWVGSFTPWPLYPQRKSSRYSLDRRLGGFQSRFGRGGEKKNSQPPPGVWTPQILFKRPSC
jgi:hypothetical protein